MATTSTCNVWAVGYYFTKGVRTKPLIEHWNGKAWKIQRSACPVSADACELGAVAATSATNAWAVGSYRNPGSGSRNLALRWNGNSWG